MYVYALGRPSHHTAPVRGLDGEPVETVRDGELTAFVSPAIRAGVEPGADALSRHNDVVEALMDGGVVLPLRFGTVVHDEAALRAVVADRRQEFARLLERLSGRIEIGARAVWRRKQGPPPANGRDFMRAKLELRAVAREAVAELHAPLVAHAADTALRVAPDSDAAFAAAYLVDRGAAEPFARRIDALRRARPDVELVRSGPWPPYSFSADG